MKTLNLNAYGVEEMNQQELFFKNGGGFIVNALEFDFYAAALGFALAKRECMKILESLS